MYVHICRQDGVDTHAFSHVCINVENIINKYGAPVCNAHALYVNICIWWWCCVYVFMTKLMEFLLEYYKILVSIQYTNIKYQLFRCRVGTSEKWLKSVNFALEWLGSSLIFRCGVDEIRRFLFEFTRRWKFTKAR